MFKSKITFIIGAGASREVGLPSGTELIPIIRQKVNFKHEMGVRQTSGDAQLFEVLRQNARLTSQDVNDYGNAGRKIANGLLTANSIDDFLDMHNDDGCIRTCGKLAIAQTILEQEKNRNCGLTHSTCWPLT
jgi:hypothetical protein